MMTRSPFFFLHMSPFSKLLFLIMIVFSSFLTVFLIGFMAGIPFFGTSFLTQSGEINYDDPSTVAMLKYFQIISQLGFFIVPAFLFATLMEGRPSAYLFLTRKTGILSLLLVACLVLFSMPLISWLIEINESMHLPAFLKKTEAWMKESEAQAGLLTEAFLKTSSWGGFAVNILMIAVIPAIGEELLFRGILVRLFREWTRNIHWAVIISAILFSSMHLQFYGFIPRLVLGLILGYLFVWSARLWVAIWAHFVNNITAVIAAFLFAKGWSDYDLNQSGNTALLWEILLSVLLTGVLLWVIFKHFLAERAKKRELHD